MVLSLIKIVGYYIFILLGQLLLCLIIFFIIYPAFKNESQTLTLKDSNSNVVSLFNLSPFLIQDKTKDLNTKTRHLEVLIFGNYLLIIKAPKFGKSKYLNTDPSKAILKNTFHSLNLFYSSLFISAFLSLILSSFIFRKPLSWIDRFLYKLSVCMRLSPIFIFSIIILTLINYYFFHFESIKHELNSINFFICMFILSLENILLLYTPITNHIAKIKKQKYILKARSQGKKIVPLIINTVLRSTFERIAYYSSKFIGKLFMSLLFLEYILYEKGLGDLFFKAFYHRDLPLIIGLLFAVSIILTGTKLMLKILTTLLIQKT